MTHTISRHKTEKYGLRGRWENVTADLDAKTWNSASRAEIGMVAGVEIKHEGVHLGVLFPDGRWRAPAADWDSLPAGDTSVFLDDEVYQFEKDGEVYAITYHDERDHHLPSLLVMRRMAGGCCCPVEAEAEYNYCPHCGGELP